MGFFTKYCYVVCGVKSWSRIAQANLALGNVCPFKMAAVASLLLDSNRTMNLYIGAGRHRSAAAAGTPATALSYKIVHNNDNKYFYKSNCVLSFTPATLKFKVHKHEFTMRRNGMKTKFLMK